MPIFHNNYQLIFCAWHFVVFVANRLLISLRHYCTDEHLGVNGRYMLLYAAVLSQNLCCILNFPTAQQFYLGALSDSYSHLAQSE